MRKVIMLISAILMLLAEACTTEIVVSGSSDVQAGIFPDYKDITVPCNIAPLNFEVTESVSDVWALKIVAEGEEYFLRSDGVRFTFGKRFWKKLLNDHKGECLTFILHAKVDGDWVAYPPFGIEVAHEPVDPYLVYRKIPPGYSLWQEMGIYQRSLETFDEKAVYRNTQGRGNCVNCHSFRDRDADDMLFHMRSELAGTYVFRDGRKEKLDTKTDSTMSALVYPYWHPSGRYVAFSVNKTNQVLHVRNANRIEVFDEDSDVVVYDVERHEIVSSDLLRAAGAFETFPTFSPDGRSLYFCSAEAVKPMPERFREVKYSLCRVDFHPEDRSFGTVVDTLYNAGKEGRSVSFPRVSPDGKHLAFVLSGYGNFSIWHKDADLHSFDLEAGSSGPMTELNSDDVESYHSWSGNSRWLVFSSRRDDGLYTKPYIGYVDAEGNAHKPFLLPQKDPGKAYGTGMFSFNIPEFTDGKISLDGREIADFAMENDGVKVKFENIQ